MCDEKKEKRQIEALKLLADWCKLLITIETAAIAAMGAFIGKTEGSLSEIFRISCSVSLLAFIGSIILTVWTMVCIPTSIQDLNCHSFWDRKAVLFKVYVPFWTLAYAQGFLFVAGIVAFAVGVIGRLIS